MIRPAQHVLLGQGRAGEPEPAYSYPVSTNLLGLWDINGYQYTINEEFFVLTDLSGNENDLVSSGGLFYREGFIETGTSRVSKENIMNEADIKGTPFTMVIRVENLPYQGSTFRYFGIPNPLGSGEPEMLVASDDTIRFNNGSISFSGPAGGAGTIAVRNNGDATVDIFLDGVEVVTAGSVPGKDLFDAFRIGDNLSGGFGASVNFVFAALHKAALSDAEIVAIHDYAIGA